MDLTMPVLKQTPSPNYSHAPISHDIVFMHVMEGGCAGSVAWLCQTESGASVHLCMSEDGQTVYQLVPFQFKAWAECSFNGRGISIELPGFTAQGLPDERWRAAAKIAAWLCRTYGIPPVWAPGGQGRGIAQHNDLGAAGGGHHDCSPIGSAVWQTFLGYVKEFYDAFGDGPLPAWGLHGAPAPHTVELPPNVPAEPSHGGATRNEPGDVVAHPTASTYPHGSAADLQWRLNKAGASPALAVDGIAGSATRNAIAAFQGKHGLFIDGLIGPLTWAALDAATT